MAEANPLLKAKYLHTSYVTNRFKEAAELLQKRYNVRNFADIGSAGFKNGEGLDVSLHIGYGYQEPIFVELIEPISGPTELYSDALKNAPSAPLVWHHVCLQVPTSEDWQAIKKALIAEGTPIAIEMQGGNMLHADYRKTMGHTIEYLVCDDEVTQFHDSLRK